MAYTCRRTAFLDASGAVGDTLRVARLKTAQPPPEGDAYRRRITRALREAALELFEEQGYDATRTEDIAERVGLSARTFFRYFPTKESVLFALSSPWFQTFADCYRSAPPELGDLDAMRHTLATLAPTFVGGRSAVRRYDKILDSSDSLAARKLQHQKGTAQMVAEAIAGRRGMAEPDGSCKLIADIGMLAYRRALASWLDREDSDLALVVAEEFDFLDRAIKQAQGPATTSSQHVVATPRRGRIGRTPSS
jgi:AcrR family transcriptional regulator